MKCIIQKGQKIVQDMGWIIGLGWNQVYGSDYQPQQIQIMMVLVDILQSQFLNLYASISLKLCSNLHNNNQSIFFSLALIKHIHLLSPSLWLSYHHPTKTHKCQHRAFRCSCLPLNQFQIPDSPKNEPQRLQTSTQTIIQTTLQKMCSCLLSGIGCCVSACCKDTAQSCGQALGKQKVTKICYLFLVVIFTVPAIAILFFINKWSSYANHFSWMSCPSSSGGGQFDCIGPSTVFRVSLSFLCLFGSLLIFMLCRNAISMCINQGFFCFKYLIVLGIFIAFLFAPNDSFNSYATASKYISIVFMAVQSIILVDLFYLAGIKLVARYDSGDSCCGVALITLTLIFYGVAVLLNVLGYVYFGSADACGSSLWVNVATSGIIGVLPFLQLLNFNKQNSLLTTSLVSLYISYLALIGQFSYGGDFCTGRISVNSIAADIIVSTFIFILTMYGSIMGGTGQVKISENINLNQAMGVAPTGPESLQPENPANGQKYQAEMKPVKPNSGQRLHEDAPENDQNNLAKYSDSYNWIKWHFYMCLASIYIGMLVTNWTSASLTTGSVTSNGFGFWVRVGISGFTALLYVWTLIAPKVFPDRDFTVV